MIMGRSKVPYVNETIVSTDFSTGEVKEMQTQKRERIYLEQDEFYMVYIDFMAPYFKLFSDTAKSVLGWMCKHAEYNTGKVSLSSADRKAMMDELGIRNRSSVSNCLKLLKDRKVISGDGGSYLINPKMFWKGENSVRNKFIKTREFEIIFNIPGTESGVFEDGWNGNKDF